MLFKGLCKAKVGRKKKENSKNNPKILAYTLRGSKPRGLRKPVIISF